MSSNSTATPAASATMQSKLAKFAKLVAHPLIYHLKDFKVPHYSTLVVTCDCCQKDGLETFVRSHYQPDVDVCVECYNAMQTWQTPVNTVAKAQLEWQQTEAQLAADCQKAKEERDASRGVDRFGLYWRGNFDVQLGPEPTHDAEPTVAPTKKRKTQDKKK